MSERTGKLQRVVVTSKGFVTALGSTSEDIVSSMRNLESVYENLEFDPEIIAAPVKKFELKNYIGRYKNIRYLNRGAALGLAAAMKTVKASGLDDSMLKKAGLITGTGPNMDIGGEVKNIDDGNIDPGSLKALWLLRFLPNTCAAMIADLAGIHGENFTISTACATGIQVIGEAYRKIRNGHLDVVLAGSWDSRLHPGGVMAYKMAGALYTGNLPPHKGHRPFDTGRGGFAMGEGSAFFMLESLEHALERGADILAEVCGFGSSMDGGSMTAPDPTGRWMEAAVTNALNDAQVEPHMIDVVSAHGTGTDLNDAMETRLLERIFKDCRPWIIALKSWIGHTSAACGAVELALVLCLMQHNYIPKIVNLETPVSTELNFVRKNMENCFNSVLLENFGFGGQNGAIVVKRWTRD